MHSRQFALSLLLLTTLATLSICIDAASAIDNTNASPAPNSEPAAGLSSNASNKTSGSNAAKPMLLKAEIATFGVLTEQLQTDLGLLCTRDSAGAIRIAKIRLGTEAAYNGLEEGDKLLSAKAEDKDINISFERGGHVYGVKLRYLGKGQTYSAKFSKSATTVAIVPPSNFNLGSQASSFPLSYEIDQKKIRLLANYQLEIIMDRSLSMRATDCPGHLSRWDWCGMQATDIAKALEPYLSSGLTLIPFNNGFDVYEHASAKNIVDVFNDHSFILGTRLYEPLSQRLDHFFDHYKPTDKPLLIVVITDGEPWPNPQPDQVRDELVQASQRITKAGQVTVVFLQIGGNDRAGRDYLVDLGQNLTAKGARYQYVHTTTFEELEATGLAHAIISTVEQYAPPAALKTEAPAKAARSVAGKIQHK